MKVRNLLMSALLATTFLAAPVLAETAGTAPAAQKGVKEVVTTTQRVVRPLAIDGHTKELKPAIQRFVERIQWARYALATKDPQRAQINLDEAEKHLEFIRNNSRLEETVKDTVIKSGKVTTSSTEEFSSYYIPLEEGPVVVRSLEAKETDARGNNMKGLAVASADMVYLNVDLTGQEAPAYIAKARAAMKSGDLRSADRALAEMIDKVATARVVETLPGEKAYDNALLAIKFLKDDNFSAARYSLNHVNDALKSMQGDARYNQDDVADLSKRVAQISDMVMQATPEAGEKSRVQMNSVRDKLETMRSVR